MQVFGMSLNKVHSYLSLGFILFGTSELTEEFFVDLGEGILEIFYSLGNICASYILVARTTGFVGEESAAKFALHTFRQTECEA